MEGGGGWFQKSVIEYYARFQSSVIEHFIGLCGRKQPVGSKALSMIEQYTVLWSKRQSVSRNGLLLNVVLGYGIQLNKLILINGLIYLQRIGLPGRGMEWGQRKNQML